MTRSMLETRVRRGRVVRVHPGVYRVAGSTRTFEQRCVAATAWAGAGAVVSHAAAAYLWGMVDGPPAVCDISSLRKLTRPPSGVRPHFTTDLPPRDRGKLRSVPVTSSARTLIDLAGVAGEADVDNALHRAIVDGLATARVLRERIAACERQGKRGPAVLRRLLQHGRATASPLERAVAGVLTCRDLPSFRREHPVYVDGRVFYLDFALPAFRVGVEADGRRWHSDPSSFESDRDRGNRLAAAGWTILRVTEQQIRADPALVRRQVLDLVRAARG